MAWIICNFKRNTHCFYTDFARVNELQQKTNAFTIVKKTVYYIYLVCVGKVIVNRNIGYITYFQQLESISNNLDSFSDYFVSRLLFRAKHLDQSIYHTLGSFSDYFVSNYFLRLSIWIFLLIFRRWLN